MTRVPDKTSEADGMMDNARELIENRCYPVLGGPGPGMSVLLALAFANLTFLLLPSAETIFAVAAVLFIASAGTALRMRPGARSSDLVTIGLLSAIAFGWAYAVYFSFAAYGAAMYHTVLSVAALVFGFARYLRCFRYSWSTAVAAAPMCDADLLANYGEYLLDHRPGTASSHVAREFYRIASEEVLHFSDPAPRHIGLVKRYIDMLQSGIGGYADIPEAAWWLDRVRELEDGARVPVSSGLGVNKTPHYDARETSAGAGEGSLGYRNGRPTWRVRVPHPNACETGTASLSFRTFLLPNAGLVACRLLLDQGSGQPLVLHRLFDVSDPETEAFMMAGEHYLAWRLELRRRRDDTDDGQTPDEAERPVRVRTLNLAGTGFMECLDAVIRHNGGLGVELDGAAAIAFCTATLASHDAVGDGLDAAWAAIDAACLRFEDEE